MARLIDVSKIERIKKACIDVSVAQGIENTSVSKIANTADVSVGYLYRYYISKEELIKSIFSGLFQQTVNEVTRLTQEYKSVKDIVKGFLMFVFENCNTEPNKALFLLKLMTDYSFKMGHKEKDILNDISHEILKMGKNTGEINSSIDKELLYTLLIGSTYFFINMRKREVFSGDRLTEKDADKITELYMKAIA